MSNSLEGRFEWYRQTNGGNFFVSLKQLLHFEKKIRCLSLLQEDALLTTVQHCEFDNDISTDDQNEDCNRCDGVVVRASALQSVDLGFIP